MLLIAGPSLHSLFRSVCDELLGLFLILQGSKRVETGLTVTQADLKLVAILLPLRCQAHTTTPD